MRKPILLILFLAAVYLTACSLATTTTTPTKIPPTATLIITPTATVSYTPSPSPSAETNLCLNKLSTLPSGVALPGRLVFSLTTNLSVLDFEQNSKREVNGHNSGAAVSPDGKWLSYFHLADAELTVESADGQVKARIPANTDWLTLLDGGTPWLDNENLWVSTWPDIEKGQSAPVVIINPFTGKQQKLLSNYPNLERYPGGMMNDPGLHFIYSSVSYNPSLEMVAYPEVTKDGDAYITLLDRQSGKVLAKILDGGLYGYFPLWLPGGSQFVVPAQPSQNGPREWMMVSRDGTVKQLTHFQKLYRKNFEIGSYYSVSPDGNYLAFGLSRNEDTDSNEPKQLMILNLKTLDVTNLCVSYLYPRPVWSPDSQYLIVKTLVDRNPSAIVAINLQDKWIVDLPEDPYADPVGWLKVP